MGIYKKENLSTMATVEEIGKDAQSGSDKEEEMPELENQEGPKLNRGEKKCRKALMKLGMKQFAGITRVTMRKRDGYIFVINEPEVLKSADGGNSFVCFGEIKVDDPNQRLQQAEAKRFAEHQAAHAAGTAHAHEHDHEHPEPAKVEEKPKKGKKGKKKEEDEGEAANEEGITPGHINMVMEHTGCTRNAAIEALRESGDDMINAVMKLTK